MRRLRATSLRGPAGNRVVSRVDIVRPDGSRRPVRCSRKGHRLFWLWRPRSASGPGRHAAPAERGRRWFEDSSSAVTVPLALLLALASAAMAQTPAPGDDAGVRRAPGALIDNVRLPLLAEVWVRRHHRNARQHGRHLPRRHGEGRAKLDARWSPGNPHYDHRALRLVEKAIGGEGSESGSAVRVVAIGVSAQLPAPWSVGEIDFPIDVTRTDDGRIITEFYDAASVPMRSATWASRRSTWQTTRCGTVSRELRLEARDKFGVAAPRFAEARERNPGPSIARWPCCSAWTRADRLRHRPPHKTEPTQRLSRAVFDVLPDLHAEIAAFKRSIGEPTPADGRGARRLPPIHQEPRTP